MILWNLLSKYDDLNFIFLKIPWNLATLVHFIHKNPFCESHWIWSLLSSGENSSEKKSLASRVG